MKKFLFTLAALMMAGSLCAENYFFIEDFEVPQDKLGGTVKVDVKAHFDNYVSAWQFDLGYVNEDGDVVMNQLPEGITKVTSAAGADMKNMTYTGDDGEEYSDYSPNLKKGQEGTRIIVAADQGDYSPEGEVYGCVKWAPGEYNQMWTFTFTFDAGFKGATLVLQTAPACGSDERPEVAENAAPKGEVFVKNTVVTVEGGSVEPEVTATPTINVEDNAEGEYLVISATGDGTVKLYIDGMPVSNPFQYNYQDEEHVITITATAQEEGKEISETATLTYTVPAKAVEPPVTYQTPAPELTYVVNDDAVVFTATGEGTVTIYINELRAAEPVATGEGTATYTIARGEEDVYVSAWATAQRDEEALVGISESQYVLIPALEQVGPQDPHAEGMWLVLIDKNGEPVYVELTPGQGAQVALDYPTYGGYNAEMDPENPDVRYYFLIDGVRYGAEVEDDVTNMGDMAQTLQNPLVEGENCYVIPTGYNYLIGVYVASDGSMFVMCAQAGFTGIDELVNGKTVAGVRYFNMAGQEMQEANGVTIVVTTYTDGTTTAVKVIK